MVVMLRQCCCGCSLKTGTTIIGVLNAIWGSVILIRGIAAASGDYTKYPEYAEYAEYEDTIIAVDIVLAVIGAIMLLVAICLIVGAEKDNPVLLMPWMLYTVVFLILETVVYIVNAAQYFQMGWSFGGTGNLVGAVTYILLETYFLLVVYSLFRELRVTAPLTNV